MAPTPCRKVGSRRALVYPMLSETVNSRRGYAAVRQENDAAPKNAVPSRHREGTARRRQIPDLVKRLATATGGLGVGVGNFEAGLHQAVNVVDFRTGEIQSALHVNKDLDPIAHEHLVVGILLFLKTHLILQTRTAATNDAHTQGVFLLHISRGQLANLAGGSICNGNHYLSS